MCLACLLCSCFPVGLAKSPTSAVPPANRVCDASKNAASTVAVWNGKGDWLFETSDYFTEVIVPKEMYPYFQRLATELKARDILPVALFVPTRGSVLSRQLLAEPDAPSYDAQAAATAYHAFVERMNDTGFLALDLLPIAQWQGDKFFFKRDHHWQPYGAHQTALAVAYALKPRLAALPRTAFVTRKLPAKTQLGSLQERAEAACLGLHFPLEAVAQFETTYKQGAASSVSLFDDVEAPVALVGTSNSLRGEDKPEVNFSGFLRDALQREVVNVSFAGAGSLGSFEAYLLSEEYKNSPPKILIWESLYMGWHRNPFILDQLRRVIPSTYGGCHDPIIVRSTQGANWQGGIPLLSDLDPLRARGHRYYLQIALEDVSLVELEVQLTYGDRSEKMPIRRTTRVPNSGVYYIELSDTVAAPLSAVSLAVKKQPQGKIHAALCRAPEIAAAKKAELDFVWPRGGLAANP